MNTFALCFFCLETFILVSSLNPFKDDSEIDYSSSAFDVKRLAHHEQKLIRIMVHYKNSLEAKLNFIKRYRSDFQYRMRRVHSSREETTVKFDDVAKDPLKILQLVLRCVEYLPSIESLFDIKNDHDFLSELEGLRKLQKFPTLEDLDGAMLSVIRLKQTYDIPLKQLAIGNFSRFTTNSGLSAQNCFEIGQKSVEQEVFSTAIDFFEMALQLGANTSTEFPKRLQILEEAIQTHDEFLKTGKFDLDDNPFHFAKPLRSPNHLNFRTRTMEKISLEIPKKLTTRAVTVAFDKLCSQETLRNASSISTLHCFYIKNRNYILHPFKAEFHSLNPPILQIYDVLTENEMEMIRKEAQPELSRSRIVSLDQKVKGNITYFRTSSTTWIYDILTGSPFQFVNKRVELITELELKKITSSESLQIANYAPGGFYTSHYDAVHEASILKTLDPAEFEFGDRIATFMIYLSDVELGGGTAFPLLGVHVQAIKGSALFWYNLYSDGSINRLMLHGGCPIIYGNKWVANKWIRSHDQMFTRKCPTTQSKDVWI